MPKLLSIGDLLKAEADWKSRVAIEAPAGTKIGQIVNFPLRNEPLVALSDEEHGQVLVQPHNCTIYLDNVDMDALTAYVVDSGTGEKLTAEKLIAQGDKHGIKYISTSH